MLSARYRSLTLERLAEVSVEVAGSLDAALASCLAQVGPHTGSVVACLEGDRVFVNRLALPAVASKQLSEVLAYELEAQLPIELDGLVWDHRVLARARRDGPLLVLTGAARLDHVRDRIELIRRVAAREVDRVGCGPLPLANLVSAAPPLGAGVLALVDLGDASSEVVVLEQGEPVFARTLSRGVDAVRQSPEALAAELRQSLLAWQAKGGAPVERVHLVGVGAALSGAEAYLGYHLGTPIAPLPPLELAGIGPDLELVVPRFTKAIALALAGVRRPRDLDLRQGPLAFERGFGFLKEKAPVLVGLAGAIAVSFAFATWAELRTLERERTTLTAALGSLTRDVLGEETTDPARATELVQRGRGAEDSDPLPKVDAFDVIVELSEGIPTSVTHDIEELDVQKGHVKLTGVVGSAADAETVLGVIKAQRCFPDAKIGKITQVVNTDKQKYALEFDLRCPEESKKKKKPEGEAEAP
ncbi:MAG: general secretion pathway protein GspL [Polyangiaceae bacterium]|nr:general secretion pathway protein GspL [Polyangiaceae bacterium]